MVRLEFLASFHLHGAVDDAVRSERLQTLNFHDHDLRVQVRMQYYESLSYLVLSLETPRNTQRIFFSVSVEVKIFSDFLALQFISQCLILH